ncbi:MAG: sigma-70 family RNA polymerase sigma factor [Candidatus Omnitrophica bacterium]|nr:sigma-70 family RNA polymerase sigma factor [Candidatus Omnitrophota bacterium]MCB9782373.1 sigma-70 family RNA polymerase sigma factor [Candidatus Omnitrophota bacterium]
MDRASLFRKVLEEHKNRVYTEAYYSLGSEMDAEDVTQEAFVRLWKNFSEIDLERVGGWLVRVTRNLCIDTIRRRQADHSRRSAEDPETALENAQSAEADPRDQALHSEEEKWIRESIASLEEPYRSTVILREIQHLSYDEIAEALKIPIGSVKVHLHRGRKMLRELLRREMTLYEN